MIPVLILYAITSGVIGIVILNFFFNAKRSQSSNEIYPAVSTSSKYKNSSDVNSLSKLLTINETIHEAVDMDGMPSFLPFLRYFYSQYLIRVLLYYF
jgi:hypothetical protein